MSSCISPPPSEVLDVPRLWKRYATHSMARRTFVRQLISGESSWHAFISHSETADVLERIIPIGGMQSMTLHESYKEVLDAFRDTSNLHFS